MTPVVSWVVPVYDAEETLGCALRSVQSQTFADWECIVVDDGSRDRSVGIARGFQSADARFRVLERAHGGIVEALNAGVGECRGRYVARLDSDDVAHSRRLDLQVAALEERGSLCAVGTHVKMFPRRILSDGLLSYERWLTSIRCEADVRREVFIECPIAHPTLCIRREVLARYGYRNLGFPEDYDLVLRLVADGKEIGIVGRRLVGWRDRPDRLSRTSTHCRQDRIVACKAHHLARGFLSAGPEYVLWGYGDTGRVLCRALAHEGKRPTHIVEVHPGRIGQKIAGARVIAFDELSQIPRRPLVVSVAGESARAEIRAALVDTGFTELDDFVCAA